MGILAKIKKHGLTGTVRVIGWNCAGKINDLLYLLCRMFPVNRKLMVFESEGDLSDNAFALYDYVKNHGLLKKYRAVWLVDDVERARKNRYENTVFVKKYPRRIDWKRSFYLATCRWYIYDHCNVFSELRKREECTVINLWHGCWFKPEKKAAESRNAEPDYMLVTGKLYIDVQMNIFGYPREKFLDIGYPRNDYLFKKVSAEQKAFRKKYDMEHKQKVFLWMPTFRRSDTIALDEAYFDSATGLPVIDNLKKLERFNNMLASDSCLCLFKLHHLQAKLNVFNESFSNVKLLRDEDIREMGLQLYEVLPLTDCLITDYSSVANDYMLLDRPIIFTVDDFEKYRETRGFIPEDPRKYFAGYCVEDEEQLTAALKDVIEGKDRFCERRKRILPEMHTHADGNTSERILSYFKL